MSRKVGKGWCIRKNATFISLSQWKITLNYFLKYSTGSLNISVKIFLQVTTQFTSTWIFPERDWERILKKSCSPVIISSCAIFVADKLTRSLKCSIIISSSLRTSQYSIFFITSRMLPWKIKVTKIKWLYINFIICGAINKGCNALVLSWKCS